jgi:hypothetical protein
LSEQGAKLYDLAVRPLVQAAITDAAAETLRQTHPIRMKRRMLGDANPLMVPVREAARRVERERHPAVRSNPFLALEKLWADSVVQSFDFWRDLRDASLEMKFFGIYGSPLMNRIGASHAYERERIAPKDLQHLPEVEAILRGVERGGFEEAVIRMLILLADSRGTVRRDRLERSAHVLAKEEPFAALGAERRAALIREQAIMVEFAPERAIAALPKLLRERQERERAIERVEYIAGAVIEMEPRTIEILQKMRSTLGLPVLTVGAEPPAALEDLRESA